MLDLAPKERLTLYHPFFDGVLEIIGEHQSACIGGGTTAGLKAIVIAYVLGYRKIHLYGFDSSYHQGENHAYPQAMNALDRVIDVSFAGKDYKCATWMVTQAEDFQVLGPEMLALGCELYVHGSGFLPDIAKHLAENGEPAPPDLRAKAILSRLNGHSPVKGAEIGVFAGDLSKRLLSQRPDLTLYMVDSWGANQKPEFLASDDFHGTLTQDVQDGYAEFTRIATSFAGDRAQIVHKLSADAVGDIADGSLDFVFIDADHSYEGCKADIENWYPKVRNGGFIGGHDYANGEHTFGPMVKRAVDEMIPALGLKLELDANYTWFARKPEN